MTTTDDEIRDLLRAVRRAERPSAGDRTAVRAGLAGALVSSVAAPTLATAAKAAAITGKGSGLATLLVPFLTGAVLGSGVSAGVFLTSRTSPVAGVSGAPARALSGPSTVKSGASVAPVPVISAAPAADPLVAEAPAQASARAASDSLESPSRLGSDTTGAPAPRAGIDPLEAESRSMAEVQRALRDGRPALALSVLEAEERARPAGALAEERAAARIFALCALERRTDAERAASEFLRRFPRSPLAERVRTSCGAVPSGSR
jgi:hypothetical protein